MRARIRFSGVGGPSFKLPRIQRPITAINRPQPADSIHGETAEHLVPQAQQHLARDIGAHTYPQDLD